MKVVKGGTPLVSLLLLLGFTNMTVFYGILDYRMRNNSRCSNFLNGNVSKECFRGGLQHFYISMGSFPFPTFTLTEKITAITKDL